MSGESADPARPAAGLRPVPGPVRAVPAGGQQRRGAECGGDGGGEGGADTGGAPEVHCEGAGTAGTILESGDAGEGGGGGGREEAQKQS